MSKVSSIIVPANRIPRQFTMNRQSDQARELSGWWSMRSSWGGNAAFDDSGGYRNLVGGAGSQSPGWAEGIEFVSANSQYVEADNTPVTARPLTMSLWVRPSDLSTDQQFMCLVAAASDNDWFSVVSYSGTAAIQVNQAGSFADLSGGTLVVKRWHLLTGVWLTTGMICYLNGVAVASSGATQVPLGVSRIALGGLRRLSPVQYCSAQVLDARLYNRGLSASEVWALYNPATRYELYQEVGRRSYFYAPAAGGSTARYGDHHHALAIA